MPLFDPNWALGGSQSSILSPQLFSGCTFSPAVLTTFLNVLRLLDLCLQAALGLFMPLFRGQLHLDVLDESQTQHVESQSQDLFSLSANLFFFLNGWCNLYLVTLERNRVIWTPFLSLPPNTESWQFYSLNISCSASSFPSSLYWFLTGSQLVSLPPISLSLPSSSRPGVSNFFFCKRMGGEYFWLCELSGLQCNYSTLLLQCEAAIDNTPMNEHGCVPTKNHLQKQVEGQVCPIGQSWLAPALHQGQGDLSKRQVESYVLSCLKAFSASPSPPSSSQSPRDLASRCLLLWRLHCALCVVCSSVLFVVPRTHGSICQFHTIACLSPQPRRLFVFLPPSFWGCCLSL